MKRKIFLFITIMLLIFNCVPTLASTNNWVLDKTNVLSDETTNYIKNLNENIFRNYKNKPQLAIIIIDKLPSGYTMDKYKLDTFNNYGVGTKEENCGMLFILSLTDRKYGFEIGDGYKKGSLLRNDLNTNFISSDIIELLKDEDYDSVIMNIVKYIEKIMLEEENGIYLEKQKIKDQQIQKNVNTLSKWIMIIVFPIAIIYIFFKLYKNIYLNKKINKVFKAYEKQINLLEKDKLTIFKEIKLILKYENRNQFNPIILKYLYNIYIEENKNKLLRKIENEIDLNLSESEHNLFLLNLFKTNNYNNFLNIRLKSLDTIIYKTIYEIQQKRKIYNDNVYNFHLYINKNMNKIDTKKVLVSTLEKNIKQFCNTEKLLSENEIEKIFKKQLKSLEFDNDFECFLNEHNSEINSKYFNKSSFYNNLRNSNEYRNYSSRNTNNNWMLYLLHLHMQENKKRIQYEQKIREQEEKRRREEELINESNSFGDSFGGGSSSGGGFSGGW